MPTYIYGLVCPVAGQVRYVGKTLDLPNRLRLHIQKAQTGQVKHHCAQWIRKLLRQNLAPTLIVLYEVKAEEDWRDAEKRVIREYREAGAPLTNSTGGGDGFHKLIPELIAKRVATRRIWWETPGVAEAHSAKLIEAHKRPGRKERASAVLAAAWQDPVKREAMLTGMAAPEAKERRGAATKRRYEDPEVLEAHSAVVKARVSTPEGKAQLDAAREKRWADYRAEQEANPPPPKHKPTKEETSAKMSASAKARRADPVKGPAAAAALRTPEARENASRAAIERATPEYRATMAEKTRLSWEKRRAKKSAEKEALLK